VGIFDRKKHDPSGDELAARLTNFVSQAFPTPAPVAEEETGEMQPTTGAPVASGSADDTASPRPEPVAAMLGTTPLTDDGQRLSPNPRVEPAKDQLPIAPQGPVIDQGRTPTFSPKRPEIIEETGLSRTFLTDLVLRTLYAATELTGAAIAERVALPFQGIVGELLESLRHEQAVEIKAQRGIGDAGYLYAITEKGVGRARESMDRLTYVGPAPVTFDDYVKSVLAQSIRNVVVTQENIRVAFQDLIVQDSVLDEVGPAVNSGSSMFLFGFPGNGKTSIAERITKLMGDYFFVPYAVEVDGAVIKVFDAINHTPVVEEGVGGQPRRPDWDARWVKIERPVVTVGGELTMASLDLLYNESGKYYEAPLQMKANGGMFLIDDFGRQMIRPQDLLNRWIVPLEKRIDFLTLATGKKIAIPFEQLIVFSTNLDPKDLVDEAFLRRIKFKINVLDPDENQFRQIFMMMCTRRSVPFDERMFQYLLDKYYRPTGRPLRMCHPRDIIDQIISIAKYKMVKPEMSESLLDRACETYFVTLS